MNNRVVVLEVNLVVVINVYIVVVIRVIVVLWGLSVVMGFLGGFVGVIMIVGFVFVYFVS